MAHEDHRLEDEVFGSLGKTLKDGYALWLWVVNQDTNDLQPLHKLSWFIRLA